MKKGNVRIYASVDVVRKYRYYIRMNFVYPVERGYGLNGKEEMNKGIWQIGRY
jgi:hypothetical protein